MVITRSTYVNNDIRYKRVYAPISPIILYQQLSAILCLHGKSA